MPGPQALGLTKVTYTVKEAMSVLSLGRTSLYKAAKSGDLKVTKFGHKTLFLATDIAAFLSKLRGGEPE